VNPTRFWFVWICHRKKQRVLFREIWVDNEFPVKCITKQYLGKKTSKIQPMNQMLGKGKFLRVLILQISYENIQRSIWFVESSKHNNRKNGGFFMLVLFLGYLGLFVCITRKAKDSFQQYGVNVWSIGMLVENHKNMKCSFGGSIHPFDSKEWSIE
jgi:hypothetical protein